MSQSGSSGSQFLNDDLSPEFTSALNLTCKQQRLPKLPAIDESIVKLWRLKAYGKLITHRTFTEKYIDQQLKLQWDFSNFQFRIVKTGLFLFDFHTKKEIDYVLEHGPWIIGGHVMSFKAWEQDKPPEKLNFFVMPFWIQLFKLPLERFTAENGKQIGSSIGEVLSVDPHQYFDNDGAYMRVRVILQANRPLPIFAEAQDHAHNLVAFPIKIERLEAFCYECGRLGHEKTACSAKESISWAKNLINKRRYTSWLKGGVATQLQKDTPMQRRRLQDKSTQPEAVDNNLVIQLPSGGASLISKENQNMITSHNQLPTESGNPLVPSTTDSEEHLEAVLSHAVSTCNNLAEAEPLDQLLPEDLPCGEQKEDQNIEVHLLARQIDAMQTDEVTEESIIATEEIQELSCIANRISKDKEPFITPLTCVDTGQEPIITPTLHQTNTMHIHNYHFLNLTFSKGPFSHNLPTDNKFIPTQASPSSQVQPLDISSSKPLRFFKRRPKNMSSPNITSNSSNSVTTTPLHSLTSRKHPRDGKDHKVVAKYSPPIKKRRLFLAPEDAINSQVAVDIPCYVRESDSSDSDADELDCGNVAAACKELATASILDLQLPINPQEAGSSQQDQQKRSSCKQ